MLPYDEYIVFIIGTDNFELSKFIRDNHLRYGIDDLYKLCINIAMDFEKSEYNYDLSISQYTALERFLEDNTPHYIDIYNKGEF